MQEQNHLHLSDYDKYQYTINNPWPVRVFYIFGFFSFILVIYGFIRFFNLSTWYWIFFGPMLFIVSVNKFITYGLCMFYPRFDYRMHRQKVHKYWKKHREPSVAVFLPVCGEDIKLIRRTWMGVRKLKYRNYRVYVLDDGDSTRVRFMAAKFGFRYLTRPNKPKFKKAGNLQYGYDHSKGKFVFVLDADFVPHPDALRETIPYMEDKWIGILQTPQYFRTTTKTHRRSKIQFGAGNVVETFYRIVMPSRDRVGGAMCVGTSAVYRRQAIKDAGGTPKVEGTEDVRQGLMVNKVGYRVKYIPLIISRGICPTNPQDYFRQHNRWCTGSIQMFFSKYFTQAKLSFLGRVSYLANVTYYLKEALAPLLSIHFICLLYFHHDSLRLVYTLPFIPHIIFYYLLLTLLKQDMTRVGSRIAAFNNMFTYLYTIPNYIFKRPLKWVAANKSRTSRITGPYKLMVSLSATYFFLFSGAFIWTLYRFPGILSEHNTFAVLFWLSVNTLWQFYFINYSLDYIYRIYKREYKKKKIRAGRYVTWQAINYGSVIVVLLVFVIVIMRAVNSPNFNDQVLADFWNAVKTFLP